MNDLVAIDHLEPVFAKNQPAYNMVKFASEKHFAMQVLKGNDFILKTAKKNPASFEAAIINIAISDISLNPSEKLAYLVPMDGKVNLQISYMGLCALAVRSKSLEWVQSKLIYEKDEFFEPETVGERALHKTPPFGVERGKVIGVYCVSKTTKGDYLTEVMTKEVALSIRDRSKMWISKKSGPWKTDENEMLKKTVVKRASKMWPKMQGTTLGKAIEIINENEGIEFENEKSDIVNVENLAQQVDVKKEYEEKSRLVAVIKDNWWYKLPHTALEKKELMERLSGASNTKELMKLPIKDLKELDIEILRLVEQFKE